jgi:glutamyl endopeptidase
MRSETKRCAFGRTASQVASRSGSGVYRFANGGRYGIAVHAYGGASTNSGTRIVTPGFNNFVAWKA